MTVFLCLSHVGWTFIQVAIIQQDIVYNLSIWTEFREPVK